MNTQTAFDFKPERAARATDPETSRMAAERVAPYVTQMQFMALQMFWYYRDAEPIDDFQLAELTDTKQTSIGKRRKELELMGYVEKAERRASPSPLTSSIVQSYRLTDAGRRFYREQTEKRR